jgi:hypothetical protein
VDCLLEFVNCTWGQIHFLRHFTVVINISGHFGYPSATFCRHDYVLASSHHEFSWETAHLMLNWSLLINCVTNIKHFSQWNYLIFSLSLQFSTISLSELLFCMSYSYVTSTISYFMIFIVRHDYFLSSSHHEFSWETAHLMLNWSLLINCVTNIKHLWFN